jgi:hypothetical protein
MDIPTFIKAMVDSDNERSRSKQTAIGVSQLGGCRRKVWHQIQGHEGTNSTLRLASIMGTAIHEAIENSLSNSVTALYEHRVEIEGYPPATIDFYDPETKAVWDWKTITLKNVPYFQSQQKKWQVMVYAYLLTLDGFEVETVNLLGIPRDGNENDLIAWSMPYDESVALEALAWLKDLEARTEAPAAEMSGVFCRDYCPFFGDLCGGIPKDFSGEPIADALATQAAADYIRLNEEIKELEKLKDAAKNQLEGVEGITFDGVKISWSSLKGRETPDTTEIEKLLGFVPMKTGAPSVRLNVKG